MFSESSNSQTEKKNSMAVLVFGITEKYFKFLYLQFSLIFQITFTFLSIVINLLCTYMYMFIKHKHTHIICSRQNISYTKFLYAYCSLKKKKRRKNIFLLFSVIWASVRSRTAAHEWHQIIYLLPHTSYYSSFSPISTDLVFNACY